MGLLFKSKSAQVPSYYRQKNDIEKKLGRTLSNEEFERDYLQFDEDSSLPGTGTSVFDPVLCETQYLWYTKYGDHIIDPFSGGSVRGIVASELGRRYTGIDIRQEQIDANIVNAEEVCVGDKPRWICGDSVNIRTLADGEYDFLFTCPPYGNLEVYSDDPADISNMSADDFDATYARILFETVAMLKQDRFASIVVGNYRDKKGYLRDLMGLTVQAMEKAGARYYNDFIFVTPNGSLQMRMERAFKATRKMGRTHQYVLNFIKGDPRAATKRLGDVELPDMEQYATEDE